jgi:hypothetical protein
MDENDTTGDGPPDKPPSSRDARPDGSPGHKCRKDGCECWVHPTNASGGGLCQPNCPGPTAAGACCDNGVCPSVAVLAEVVIVDE